MYTREKSEGRGNEQRRRLLMGTDNRLDFPLDRIAKERDEIKGEGLLSGDR